MKTLLFGVLLPRAWCVRGSGETSWMQAQCLIEPGTARKLVGELRFLQFEHHAVEAKRDDGSFAPVSQLEADSAIVTAHEAMLERVVRFDVDLGACGARAIPFHIAGASQTHTLHAADGELVGRALSERWPIVGSIHVAVERVISLEKLVKVSVRVENLALRPGAGAPREEAMRSSLIGAEAVLIAS